MGVRGAEKEKTNNDSICGSGYETMMIILAGVTREFEFRWREWNIFAQEKEGIFILAYAKHFAAFDCKGGLGSLLFYNAWKQILSQLNLKISIFSIIFFLHLDLRSRKRFELLP